VYLVVGLGPGVGLATKLDPNIVLALLLVYASF
jgi:uncharacterized membrane protein